MFCSNFCCWLQVNFTENFPYFPGHWVRRTTANGLVYGLNRSFCQVVFVAWQKTKIWDQGAQKKSQPQIRSDLHLQKHTLCVSVICRKYTLTHFKYSTCCKVNICRGLSSFIYLLSVYRNFLRDLNRSLDVTVWKTEKFTTTGKIFREIDWQCYFPLALIRCVNFT